MSESEDQKDWPGAVAHSLAKKSIPVFKEPCAMCNYVASATTNANEAKTGLIAHVQRCHMEPS